MQSFRFQLRKISRFFQMTASVWCVDHFDSPKPHTVGLFPSGFSVVKRAELLVVQHPTKKSNSWEPSYLENTGENTQDLLKTSTSSCLSRRCCTCSCCSSSPSVRSSWSLMPQQRRAKSSGFLKMETQNPRKSHFLAQKSKGVAHWKSHFLASHTKFEKAIN